MRFSSTMVRFALEHRMYIEIFGLLNAIAVRPMALAYLVGRIVGVQKMCINNN